MEVDRFPECPQTPDWLPEHVHEVEVVLGQPLFEDSAREIMFMENPEGLDIASRELGLYVYRAVVRIIAEGRSADRQRRFPVQLDPHTGKRQPLTEREREARRQFNEKWLDSINDNERKLRRIATSVSERVGALASTLSDMRFGEMLAAEQLQRASKPTPKNEKCGGRNETMSVTR